jgi:transposase InsO family protein
MQVQYIGYRVKGFYRIAAYALRCGMQSEQAQQRLKILRFFDKHGLEATREAFGVSRRTLFGWKQKLREAQGDPTALNPASRCPKRVRKRAWPAAVGAEIARLRRAHPNLGKEKLEVLLAPFCRAQGLLCPRARTIGRLIADDPGKMRHRPTHLDPKGRPKRKRPRRLRKPKGFRPRAPGELVALDTVERVRDGVRRYLITFVDVHARFGFALATTSRSSRLAAQVLTLAQSVFPRPVKLVLTDNGSEFMKDFEAALAAQSLIHWHTFPKTPKMNAHCERFNRTVQEEFLDYHEDLFFTDLSAFNDKLMDWLLWYNGERPHWALQLQSPLQFIARHYPGECNMCWPDTGC